MVVQNGSSVSIQSWYNQNTPGGGLGPRSQIVVKEERKKRDKRRKAAVLYNSRSPVVCIVCVPRLFKVIPHFLAGERPLLDYDSIICIRDPHR